MTYTAVKLEMKAGKTVSAGGWKHRRSSSSDNYLSPMRATGVGTACSSKKVSSEEALAKQWAPKKGEQMEMGGTELTARVPCRQSSKSKKGAFSQRIAVFPDVIC